MPLPKARTVRVTVKCTEREFRVTVRPWAVHVYPLQRIEWIAGGEVTYLRIRKHSPKSPLPFVAPRAALCTTKKTKRTKSGKRREFPAAALRKRVPYTIDLRFTDDKGKSRSATIDPDMVID
jgi:hypothetical protein